MEAKPGVELITHYFQHISKQQQQQFARLAPLYFEWNEKINVISRKDIESIYLKHVLHSLGIAKVLKFPQGSRVLDVGTGGGFPGIPLAILYPKVHFHLVDSIAKKVKVVREVSKALGLKNVSSEQIRAELIKQRFDFIVSRAVTRLSKFSPWVRHNLKPGGSMIFLKGGDLSEEIAETHRKVQQHKLSEYFEEGWFEGKKVLMV